MEVGLTSVEISEGVTTLQANAFTGENLEKIVIPSSITKISFNSILFRSIDCIEFKGETFSNSFAPIYVSGNIGKIIVPYSEDHHIVEYYKGLLKNNVIYCTNPDSVVIEEAI